MKNTALWLTEAEVAGHVPMSDAIDALERNLIEVADGAAFNVPKALGSLGNGGAMHALASASPRLGVCGFKTWVHTPNGAKAVFSLFGTHDGKLLAMMEANTLGQIRTAAMTALGTRWLAPSEADDLAIVGTGRQAIAQVYAINAVRPLRRVRVWSRDVERRQVFADKVRADLPQANVIVADSLEAATDGASLVTIVTRATEPFFRAGMLAPQAHLNAVGAILPTNAEFFPDVFERARAVVVDDLDNARRGSRELRERYGADAQWPDVQALPSVIKRGGLTAQGSGDVTLFKAMGMGLSDLAIATMAYERASATADASHTVPLTAAAPIRWTKG